MDDKNKTISPSTDEEQLWPSPMDVFSRQTKIGKGPLMSTPNLTPWSSFSMSLEHSGSSSQQDSGYSSFTPSSVASFREELFAERCQCSSKIPRENHEFTPPQSICSCKKKYLHKSLSSNLEYLQTISETESSPSGLFLSRGRPNGVIDLFDDAIAMDTSLYPDEPLSENYQNDNQGCLIDQMEMEEEKSIDFIDSNLYLQKNTSSDAKINEKGQSIHEENQVGNLSGEIPELDCDSKPIMRHKTSYAKKRKESKFSSVAKQVVTINRVVKSFSLNGIEQIDILYQLTSVRLNCPHIVKKIFSYLSEKDLDSVALVSKTWNELVCNDFSSYNRWKLYKTAMTLRKENLTSPTKEGNVEWVTRAGPFSPLQCIQNVRPQRSGSLNSPRRSPPVSPQSARFRSFQKAAKTLKKGERLLPCPKCFFPSHDYGSPTLQCTRSGCRHRFCVWCRNEIITGVHHDCPPRYTPKSQSNSSYKIAAVGSKTCKRKLRRLALD